MNPKITIRDVASAAKVSVATVSRFINGAGHVSPSTASRIQAVIDENGYQPNLIAKQLSMKVSNSIGLVLPDLKNPYFAEVAQAIETEAAQYDLAVLVCNTLSNENLEWRHISDLMQRRVDGLIILGGLSNKPNITEQEKERLRQLTQGIPVACVDGNLSGLQGLTVKFDIDHAMKQAVHYLYDLGHRRIDLIGGLESISTYTYKKNAYLNEMGGLDLLQEASCYTRGFSFFDGQRAMAEALENPHPPTAVISVNDLVCAGAIQVASSQGYAVPEDLSFISFDNTEYCQMLSPAVTAASIDYQAIGSTVIEYFRSGAETAHTVILPSDLILRSTVARLGAT